MMRVIFTTKSIRSLKKLPKGVQVKTDVMADILVVDYRDSRLKTKKLRTEESLYSFRIGRDYRAVFVFENSGVIKILDIRHRKDIYKKY